MTLQVKDRVLETSTTTGTGALTLAGPIIGFHSFASVCTVGDTCYYMIEAVDANGVPTGDWETGYGTYSAANTLTRTTVNASSNANAAVSFGTGNKRVGISVTAAALSAGPFLLQETITAGSAASVSFSSIPAIYRDLLIKVRGRGTTAATLIDVRIQLNGDTGANYDGETCQVNNTTTSNFAHVAQTSWYIGNIAAATATAGVADYAECTIADYRGTTFQKVGSKHAGLKTGTTGANFYTEHGSLWWRSTAAITSMLVFPLSGGFVDGSIVSLYGLM